jgi:hypothetical protein
VYLFVLVRITVILPGFGGSICLWEVFFHKSKGKETLRRSHDDLNTPDENKD